MLTPEEERDAARERLEDGAQEQLRRLMLAYHALKVQRAHLNAEYTAVLLWAYKMKDLLCAVGEVPPACPAPHDMHDTEPLGMGNGYLVYSGV